MSLQLDAAKLNELLKDFHLLTGIRIVIIDDEYNEILSWPKHHNGFCQIMQSNPNTQPLCRESNCNSFETCKKTGKLVIYNCHAGLVEATAPLMAQGLIIGYIMIGQLSYVKDKKILLKDILTTYPSLSQDMLNLSQAVRTIKYKNMEAIKAAAKILEACTYYVLLNDLISVKQERLIHKMNKYIDAHLQQEISSYILCEQLHISRTKLYEITAQYLGMGVGRYVTLRRMEKACKLLLDTDQKIVMISEQTGYADYSYFCKVFRKTYGLAPSKYREQERLKFEK